MKNEISIQTLFAEVCYFALLNGEMVVSGHSVVRKERTHPTMRPGYYYNNLPEWMKERIKNELTSEVAQKAVPRVLFECNPVEPWWDATNSNRRFVKKEKLKFEIELMKHGWKPNFEL